MGKGGHAQGRYYAFMPCCSKTNLGEEETGEEEVGESAWETKLMFPVVLLQDGDQDMGEGGHARGRRGGGRGGGRGGRGNGRGNNAGGGSPSGRGGDQPQAAKPPQLKLMKPPAVARRLFTCNAGLVRLGPLQSSAFR